MKRSIVSVIMIFMLLLVVVGEKSMVNAADCYKEWYKTSGCSSCDDSTYNSSQTDSCAGKHKRQNGIKLCSNHLKKISSVAKYYKRGFSDYNCLAYALGKNSVQSWVWPLKWGAGPTLGEFEKWIKNKGYKYTTNPSNATGKKIIYVYGVNKDGKIYVKHFARKYTLSGESVSGAETISKWGGCCLYSTSSKYAYNSASGYGHLILTCYK